MFVIQDLTDMNENIKLYFTKITQITSFVMKLTRCMYFHSIRKTVLYRALSSTRLN